MKVPKLKKNESNKSFIARVKEWETLTGKKYPRSFSGKSSMEERVLNNEPRIWGLDIPVDYSRDKDRWNELEKYDIDLADALKEQRLSQILAISPDDRLEEDKWNSITRLQNLKIDPNEPAPVPTNQAELDKLDQLKALGKVQKVSGDQTKLVKKDNNKVDDKKKPADTTGWSTIHTIDPNTGEPVGVMTNAQRLKFEKKYYSDRKAENSFTGWKPDHERSKKNRARLASIPKE